MPDTQHELTRAQNDLAQVRAALNDRRVGLFASKRLYARLGALLREIDRLEIDLAINHVTGDPDEKELATRATVYR